MKRISKTVWGSIAFIIFLATLLWLGQRTDSSLGNAVATQSAQTSSSSQPIENQRVSERMRESAFHQGQAKDTPSTSMTSMAAPNWAMSASGAPATAVVTLGRNSKNLTPNQLGEFQRVYLEKGGSANVKVQFPTSKPGDRVIAVMQDGGTINGDGMVGNFTLDEQSNVAFGVVTTAEGGLSRVLLTCGADRKTLEFWGGDDFPLKSQVH